MHACIHTYVTCILCSIAIVFIGCPQICCCSVVAGPLFFFSDRWGERSRSSSRINLLDPFPRHPHMLPRWRERARPGPGNVAKWLMNVDEWLIFMGDFSLILTKWKISPSKVNTWKYHWYPHLCHPTLRAAGTWGNYIVPWRLRSLGKSFATTRGDFPLPCSIGRG